MVSNEIKQVGLYFRNLDAKKISEQPDEIKNNYDLIA